jgi:hypothetical protein
MLKSKVMWLHLGLQANERRRAIIGALREKEAAVGAGDSGVSEKQLLFDILSAANFAQVLFFFVPGILELFGRSSSHLPDDNV